MNNEETSGGVNEVPLKRDFSEFSSLFFFCRKWTDAFASN